MVCRSASASPIRSGVVGARTHHGDRQLRRPRPRQWRRRVQWLGRRWRPTGIGGVDARTGKTTVLSGTSRLGLVIVVGLSWQVLPPGSLVVGPLVTRTQERLISTRGQGVYPGSAPLFRGKDLLPACSLLMWTCPRLQDSGSSNSGVGDYGIDVSSEPLDLGSRVLLIKVAGSLDLQLMPSYT